MGFFLSSPVFLWGLLGALIPLVLHLERRRSARTVPFTMLRFLREVERKRFLNLRILEMLLLFLRMAIIALIALALAGPTMTFTEGAPLWALFLTSRSEHRNTIILLDTSYSMAAAKVGGSPWDDANQILLATARRPRIRPTLSVYPFSDGLDRPAPTLPPVPLPPDLAKGLEQLQPQGTATDVGKALLQLRNQLGSLEGREVVVVSDLQRQAWDSLLRGTVGVPSKLRLTVVDVCEHDLVNLWVDHLDTPPLPWGYGQEETLRFAIRNSGLKASADAEVSLFEEREGLVQKQRISLSPRVRLLLEWGLRAESAESFRGWIQLEPGDGVQDALPDDDRMEFEVPVLAGKRVLMVGGGDSLTRASLTIAFSPPTAGTEEGSFLDTSSIPSLDSLPPDLGEYSFIVLFLTPGETYSEEALMLLEEFVGDGGGLLLVPSQLYLAAVEDPQRNLGSVAGALDRFGITVRGVEGSAEPLTLSRVEEDHPVFASIADLPRSSLSSVHMRNWLDLDGEVSVLAAASPPGANEDEEVPMLVERPLGSGTVLCLTTALEAQSSDLAVSSLLVPWCDAIAKYLSIRRRETEPQPVSVGRPESDLSRLTQDDQLTLGERGDVRFLTASGLPSGIPSRALGGSLTGFFLLLALLCALAELWLSNASL